LTIGQSPRRDVMPGVFYGLGDDGQRIEAVELGALDGLSHEEIAALAPRADAGDYWLVTRLRDGAEVKVARRHLERRLQLAIDTLEGEQGCAATVLLCTGEFPMLRAKKPLIEPDPLVFRLVQGLLSPGDRLGVIVPLPEQMEQSRPKWGQLDPKVRIAAASPYGDIVEVVRAGGQLGDASMVVLDCIGFGPQHRRAVAEVTEAPVVLPQTIVGRLTGELFAQPVSNLASS